MARKWTAERVFRVSKDLILDPKGRFFKVDIFQRYTPKELEEGYTSKGYSIPMKEKTRRKGGRLRLEIVPKSRYRWVDSSWFKRGKK